MKNLDVRMKKLQPCNYLFHMVFFFNIDYAGHIFRGDSLSSSHFLEAIASLEVTMNNPFICSLHFFGFRGKNFQNTFILKSTKLDAQIC